MCCIFFEKYVIELTIKSFDQIKDGEKHGELRFSGASKVYANADVTVIIGL